MIENCGSHFANITSGADHQQEHRDEARKIKECRHGDCGTSWAFKVNIYRRRWIGLVLFDYDACARVWVGLCWMDQSRQLRCSLRISLTQNEFRIIRDSKASKISIGSEPSVFGLRRKNRRTKEKNQRFFAKQRWIHSLFSLLLASDIGIVHFLFSLDFISFCKR